MPTSHAHLLEETRRMLPRAGRLRPHYSMSGVRALVRREGIGASEVSRQHDVLNHAAEGGPTGLISVVGGKITGYRGIAEEAVDQVCAQLGFPAASLTAHRPLPGAPSSPPPGTAAQRCTESPGPNVEQRRYLRATYGRRAAAILHLAAEHPELSSPVAADHPAMLAEIVYAARHEAAQTIADVFLRRTSLGLLPGHAVDAAPRAAALLGREFGWSEEHQVNEVAAYRTAVEHLYALPGDEEVGDEHTRAC